MSSVVDNLPFPGRYYFGVTLKSDQIQFLSNAANEIKTSINEALPSLAQHVSVVPIDNLHITLAAPRQITENEFKSWVTKLPQIVEEINDLPESKEPWTFSCPNHLRIQCTKYPDPNIQDLTTTKVRTVRFILNDHSSFQLLRSKIHTEVFDETVEVNARLSLSGHMTLMKFDSDSLSTDDSTALLNHLRCRELSSSEELGENLHRKDLLLPNHLSEPLSLATNLPTVPALNATIFNSYVNEQGAKCYVQAFTTPFN